MSLARAMQADKSARSFRPRIIPVLLLRDGLLYKTEKFKNPKYVGDPRVAVKIFNDKGADELVMLDINKARDGSAPDFGLIEEIAGESFMPFAYGGGIREPGQVRTILGLGAEKVIIGAKAAEDRDFVRRIADENGSQSITVCIDVKRDLFGRRRVVSKGGSVTVKTDPVTFARTMADAGAGEIVIQSVDRDGTMGGYDIELIRDVARAVDIPVVALGGCKSEADLAQAVDAGGASAAAAGAMFVFQGPHRAVLITYPHEDRLISLFQTAEHA